jgi:hypothetical protein
MNMFGKPDTIVPRWARIVGCHTSARLRPSRPRIRPLIGGSVTWNPVPKMITSAACSTPSAVTTACGRTSWIDSVTTSTLDRVSAG